MVILNSNTPYEDFLGRNDFDPKIAVEQINSKLKEMVEYIDNNNDKDIHEYLEKYSFFIEQMEIFKKAKDKQLKENMSDSEIKNYLKTEFIKLYELKKQRKYRNKLINQNKLLDKLLNIIFLILTIIIISNILINIFTTK